MTTTTTNLPKKPSIPQDWSLAFGSLTDLNYNGRSILLAVIIGILGAYTMAAVLHATGVGGVNIFLGIGVWVVIATYGFQPFAIAVAVLGGLGYAIDPKVNVGPGIKAGLEALGRIVNFAMMIAGFTFLFYGTWPLGIPFMGYPIILMGIIFVNNILFYERMASSGWAWKIGGYYTIVLLIIVLFGQIPIVKAAGTWINETQVAAADAILRDAGIVVDNKPPAPVVPAGPVLWQSGVTYPADRNFAVLGVIPANGATFAPPVNGNGGCYINFAAIDGSLFDVQNIGHVEDPGSKVLAIPAGNIPREAWVRTICN